MRKELIELLVDPKDLKSLRLGITKSNSREIIHGTLTAHNDIVYPISNGIPRFILEQDEAQLQTSKAFGFKWKKLDTYASASFRNNAIRWYIKKYGFTSLEDWSRFFAAREVILDIGCGSGFSSSLWLEAPYWSGRPMWIGVDISEAIDIAQQRLGNIHNTHFVQADALQLPFPDGRVDTIFSEGVLHHTPSTRLALLSASRVLRPGGEFHFYVYRRKGPVREFTDDYIREKIAAMPEEEAWNLMRSLTHLGRVLAEANTKVELKEDVSLLGIKAGVYDVQRLIYWSFAKLYWNSELSFEENVHINFDWYRPRYAHRQTAKELLEWSREANLMIQWFHEEQSGFTVRAIKN